MNLADALDQEVRQLRCEIEDLRQLLHKAMSERVWRKGKPGELITKPVNLGRS